MQAVDSLTTAFATQLGLDDTTNRCIAQNIVDSIGVDQLVSSGVLTDDLQVTDNQLTDSAVLSQLTDATLSCIDFSNLPS